MTTIDAGYILEKTLLTLEDSIASSETVIAADPLPAVLLHDFQLEQVFQNLIANAIRYRGAAPPRIQISAEPRGDQWLFSVQDNGIGIEPQFKEQIFGIFKRLHNNAAYPGTGMGLAICQRIVERAGGRIWVVSEPGRGSTFFFTIPGGGAGDRGGRPRARPSFYWSRIMQVMSGWSARRLREHGIEGELTVIGDGSTAVGFIADLDSNTDRSPDLVILDLNLPRLPGREVLKADASEQAVQGHYRRISSELV